MQSSWTFLGELMKKVQFISRPKFVHLVNGRRRPSSVSSCEFGWLQEQKREDLKRAWSSFLSSSIEQGNRPICYKDVRQKLPQLNGEALVHKLFKENDVIYNVLSSKKFWLSRVASEGKFINSADKPVDRKNLRVTAKLN